MFFDIGRQRVYLAIQTVQRSPSEETNKQRKRQKAKEDSKELEEYSLVKNKHRTLYGGQKKIVLGGPKVREARKVSRNVMEAFRKVGFRTYQPEEGAGNDFTPHKGRGKD